MALASADWGDPATAPVIEPGQTLTTISVTIADQTLHPGFRLWWWAGFTIATAFTAVFVLAVEWLFVAGVGIWGIDIPVAWGFAIANYVWWIGIASGGTIISALFYLTQSEWRSAVNRIAESMTLFAAAAAGIMPILHLGRPSFFYWLFPIPNTMGLWPQFRSPLLWDFFAILTYVTSSLLFWYLGLVPDFALVRDRATTRRAQRIYGILAMGWTGSHRQWRLHKTAYGLLAALMAPLVVSVHSIVGLDFSGGLLPGWHSTQFSPFFVFGAVLSGFATVLLLVIPLRRLYRLEAYITARHLDLLITFMLLCSLLLAYSYLVDALLPFYGDDKYEQATALHRFTGAWAWSFWGAVILNVLVPQLLWLKSLRHSAWVVCLVAFGVVIGMWLERIMLVTSSLYEDFLPSSWGHYAGTLWDWLTLLGSVGFAAAGFFLFLRYVPVVAAFELKEILPPADREGGREKVPAA
ncbi:MAG TPA: NrfD/PsrC family molybdoenzyme membrane anchor subunit [Stellaceae bacterium]|jgi:molybdopterin-containing oxidoreductase family membrane subunit|nr:NrfD/PsrC family molybdoenzyme membrane anchor subunit [Stellaceae bacterium]